VFFSLCILLNPLFIEELSLNYVETLMHQNDLLRERLSSSVEAFEERSDAFADLRDSLESEKK
jgi:hypothetical protein